MKILLPILLFLNVSLFAQHTFSIVAIDAATGKIGSAGATCINTFDCGGCGGAIVISDIVPGKGALNAQATVCLPNVNLNNGIQQISSGAEAGEVLSWLLANDNCTSGGTANRQYGIVTSNSNGDIQSKGYTGASALDEAGHLEGPNYAIQGNILISTAILDSMEAGFLKPGTFEEKMMMALQGANVAGADERCLSDGVSSKSAFLRIAHPNDSQGQFTVDIIVPSIGVGEEPIDQVQVLFDEIFSSNVKNHYLNPTIRMFPNPSNGIVQFDFGDLQPQELNIEVLNIKGQQLYSDKINLSQNRIDLVELGFTGVALVRLVDSSNRIIFVKNIVFQSGEH